ncbi:MAG: beta-galactosidase [Actinomycetota bacterium]
MDNVGKVAAALGAAAALAPAASEVRVARPAQPMSERWKRTPVAARENTLLGISFRPLQCRAQGLDPARTLRQLLQYPYPLIRLGAYWNQIEPSPGAFNPTALDAEIEAAEAAGKQIILAVGAVKTFGYPECFVPAHHLAEPLPEGTLITLASHTALARAAEAFVTRVVERYRDRSSIVAWQVEHEPVDPLGLEHSWRLARGFVQAEVNAVRALDSRPVIINGYLPTSLPVRIDQWWRTRDQGDSLATARDMADILGLDVYPRHGLIHAAGRTAYLDGAARPWNQHKELATWVRTTGRKLMVTEGQAEPWEAVTLPPSPQHQVMYSCPPERVIENYNRWVPGTWAYLFWGADYWVLRERQGDASYLRAFSRVLSES